MLALDRSLLSLDLIRREVRIIDVESTKLMLAYDHRKTST